MRNFIQKTKHTFQNLGLPEYIMIFASTYVALAYLLFYAIDLRNIFGIRDWLFTVEGVYFYFTYTPFFFQHYGRNSGFAELVQWGFLGASMFLAAWYAGRAYIQNKNISKFLMILSIAFVLMLIEDAGDVRHTLMSYVQLAFDEPDQGIFGTAFEALYFAGLASVPIYALIRYGTELRTYNKAFWYIIYGFIAHALAASLSFIGTAFQMLLERDVYTIMGDMFVSFSFKIGDEALPMLWESWNAQNWLYQIGFYLMDSLVEENIEIIGNAAFLAGILTLGGMLFKKTQDEKEHVA